jgi:hypothetical protein
VVSVTLELNIHGSELSVTITNLSDQEQRLWDWHNSWGWWALSIQVRDQADKQSEISHKSRDWTKNGPDHFAMQPHERHEVLINLHDGWWEVAGGRVLRTHPLELRARLRVDPTPESAQFGVFTGSVESDWIVSSPPHEWLPEDV